MKRTLFGFLLGIIFLSICSFSYYEVGNTKLNYVKLCEYKLNGHYYVTAAHGYAVSIIHSPNCKCKK